MTCTSTAIAIFVKTPGLSPIKTRLAASVGVELSTEFYRRSVAAVAATVAVASERTGATPYWAVAEENGLDDPHWQSFSRLSQSSGGLGERLNHVFAKLFTSHSAVIAIGADSPQITPHLLQTAIEMLLDKESEYKHVLGRSYDGGFYLVGSNDCLPLQAWLNVPYSTANTAEKLAKQLAELGKIHELPQLTDVDEVQDLCRLTKQLRELVQPTPGQLSLREWMEGSLTFPTNEENTGISWT